ncbi:hypothetical protein BH23CHL8_BH23CHL8_17670 [soil metagenome]
MPQGLADLDVDDDFAQLRWFLMPDEASADLGAETAGPNLAARR